MTSRGSFRKRLVLTVLAYVVVISAGVAVQGILVNETAERLVWQSLLNAELDHLNEMTDADPAYRWIDSQSMQLFDSRSSSGLPPALAPLPQGIHDEIVIGDRERVALIRDHGGYRQALTLDISAFSNQETDVNWLIFGSSIALLSFLSLLTIFGSTRLVKPLVEMSTRISELRADKPGQQLDIPARATSELAIIGDSLNDHLAKIDRFMDRERLFIDMASHELRTPIAVIKGASELGIRAEANHDGSLAYLERIHGSAEGIQELITLLLVLAKDPERLGDAAERVALNDIIPSIVEDHEFLTEGKHLAIETAFSGRRWVLGPPQIIRAAIGNLLRNAIENSDRGTIHVKIDEGGKVTIRDPGHGMSSEEIGALYAKMARAAAGRGRGGIGLDLISRLCEHLGWKLDITSIQDGGTCVELTLPGIAQ